MNARRRRRYRLSSWALLLETALCLGLAALVKRTLPFRLFSRILGVPVETPTNSPIPPVLRTNLVWAFQCFRRVPLLKPLCLTEVLALALLLRRRGLRGSSYLGVSQKAPFQAHAWMRCGEKLLPRPQDLTPYRIIATFEHPRIPSMKDSG